MKLLIVKNSITDTATLEKGVNLAVQSLSMIGLDLQVSYYDLKKTLTSLPFSNDVNAHGYYLDPMSFTGTWDIGFDLVCCIFDATKVTPSPTNPMDNNQTMSIPVQWYTTYDWVLRDYLLHELCHYFFGLTGQKDITHYYDPAFAQKQRVEWYLYLLKGLIASQNSVTITRGTDDSKETIGTLKAQYNGRLFTCKTLELGWKGNTPNISSIPPGTYLCKYTFSLRLLKYTYEIQKVPGRSGIRIHTANYYSQLLGCVALGDSVADINGDGEPDVLNSRVTVQNFEAFMGRRDFLLVIK